MAFSSHEKNTAELVACSVIDIIQNQEGLASVTDAGWGQGVPARMPPLASWRRDSDTINICARGWRTPCT